MWFYATVVLGEQSINHRQFFGAKGEIMSLNRILGIIAISLTIAAIVAVFYLVYTYGFGIIPMF